MEYDRVRSYEVSVWTLQDDFITVLKPSNLENKGQIEEGKIELNVDGTQNISFKIPMYLEPEVVNPIWYDVKNGVLAANMRKIKTIFNKGTEEEKVFEFIIINAEETHQNDELYYDVRGEGLAFHELGKRGYKLELSNSNYEADEEVQAWYNGDETYQNNHPEPIANIQYWLKTINIPPANSVSDAEKPYTWCYELQMDWSSFTGGEDLASDKIYDEGYVSWDYVYNIDNNNYEPVVASVELPREKSRQIEISESNIYNITQKLAEVFGVFCKYEYSHDQNYHITGKKIVFYNKFYSEKLGFLDFTYPYSAEEIKRTIDSSDLVTKLYVKNIEDSTSASGLVTILDAEVNKSKEDYILNFDYLHEIKTISDEQYQKAIEFENIMSSYNAQIEPIDKELVILQDQLIDLQARATIAKNAAQEDSQRIEDTVALYNNLTGNGATLLSRGITNPDATLLKQDLTKNDNHYFYVDIGEKGAIAKTIKVYKTLNYVSKEFSNEITGGVPQYDEYGNVVRFSNLYADPEDRKSVYVTYDYRPRLYYENVEAVWRKRFSKDSADAQSLAAQVVNLQNQLSEKQALKDAKLALKKAEILDFEKEMGPAIREGYWQPEGYTDYGNRFIDSFRINISPSEGTIACKTPYASFIWDTEPFPGETENSYQIGVNQQEEYYTYVQLRNNIDVPAIKDHLNELNYLYYNYLPASDWEINRIKSLPLGSQCELGFVKDDINYNPAVILTGDRCLSDQSYFTDGRGFLGSLHTVVDTDEKKIIIDSTSYVAYNSSRLLKLNSNRKIAYPRIKIASLALKTGPDNLGITYGGHELKEFEDYYINFKDEAYYITLKPEALIRYGTVDKVVSFYYTLSTASNSVYLDALEVSRENAYPKVSYEIDPNVYGRDFMHTAYNTLGTLAHINDVKLKFNNVMGYISKVELDLDKPWEDQIEIKNYKNKFEDLFSTIVAQTEAMKAAEPILSSAANIVTLDGTLAANAVKDIIRHVDLDYAFNNGTLTIDNENGIWGTSDSGVVAFRGGGIFTSTEQDENGDWKWNTGITPEGINANLITTGQLDTNLINIYAGDNIKFQMNGNGIFAYRSFLKDIEAITDTTFLTKIQTVINNNQDVIDKKQYVMYNEDGLFLIADQGAFILNEDRDDFISQVDSETGLHQKATRVEISWDGLILRDWENNKVFYADPDTGNLTLTGIITATGGDIGGWKISQNSLYNTGIELRSIPGNDTQSAGIFVTSDTIDNYIVKDNNNVEYYIYNYYNSPNAEPVQYYSTERQTVLEVSAVTRPSIYKPEETVAIVTPLYTVDEVVTEEKEETFEVDIGDGQTEERTVTQSYTYTLYYIADENRNKVIGQNGEPVIYDGTTDPNLANNPWLNALTANQRDTLVQKTTKIVENSYVPIGETELSNGSQLQLQTFEPSLSIEAKTGKLTTNSAQLGKFILTANSLSGQDEGTLNNTKIIQSKILEGEIEGKSTKDFLRAFCDFSGNSATGTFTLTRIDGTSVNFNITAMQKYQMDMAVQYNSGYSGGYSQGYASGKAAGGGGGGGSGRTADSILTTVTLTNQDVQDQRNSYPVTVHYNNGTSTQNVPMALNLSGITLNGYQGMEFGNADEGEEGIIKMSQSNRMTRVTITAGGHIDLKQGSDYIYVVWHEALANNSVMAATEAVEIGQVSYEKGQESVIPTSFSLENTQLHVTQNYDTDTTDAYVSVDISALHNGTVVCDPISRNIDITTQYNNIVNTAITNAKNSVGISGRWNGNIYKAETTNQSPPHNVQTALSEITRVRTVREDTWTFTDRFEVTDLESNETILTKDIEFNVKKFYDKGSTNMGMEIDEEEGVVQLKDRGTKQPISIIGGRDEITYNQDGSHTYSTTHRAFAGNTEMYALTVTSGTEAYEAGKNDMKILLNASSQDTAAVSLTDGSGGAKNYTLVVNTQMQYNETTHRYTAIADVTVGGGTSLISDTDTRLNLGMQGYNDGLKDAADNIVLDYDETSTTGTTLSYGKNYLITADANVPNVEAKTLILSVPTPTIQFTGSPTLSGGTFHNDGDDGARISGISVNSIQAVVAGTQYTRSPAPIAVLNLSPSVLSAIQQTAIITKNSWNTGSKTVTFSIAASGAANNSVALNAESASYQYSQGEVRSSVRVLDNSAYTGLNVTDIINMSLNMTEAANETPDLSGDNIYGKKYKIVAMMKGESATAMQKVIQIPPNKYDNGYNDGQSYPKIRITPSGDEGTYTTSFKNSVIFKSQVLNLSGQWVDRSSVTVLTPGIKKVWNNGTATFAASIDNTAKATEDVILGSGTPNYSWNNRTVTVSIPVTDNGNSTGWSATGASITVSVTDPISTSLNPTSTLDYDTTYAVHGRMNNNSTYQATTVFKTPSNNWNNGGATAYLSPASVSKLNPGGSVVITAYYEDASGTAKSTDKTVTVSAKTVSVRANTTKTSLGFGENTIVKGQYKLEGATTWSDSTDANSSVTITAPAKPAAPTLTVAYDANGTATTGTTVTGYSTKYVVTATMSGSYSGTKSTYIMTPADRYESGVTAGKNAVTATLTGTASLPTGTTKITPTAGYYYYASTVGRGTNVNSTGAIQYPNKVTIDISNVTDDTQPGTYYIYPQIKATASDGASVTKGISVNAYEAYSSGYSVGYTAGGGGSSASVSITGVYSATNNSAVGKYVTVYYKVNGSTKTSFQQIQYVSDD